MNWAIKIISKTLMIKISHISRGGLLQRLLRYTYYYQRSRDGRSQASTQTSLETLKGYEANFSLLIFVS